MHFKHLRSNLEKWLCRSQYVYALTHTAGKGGEYCRVTRGVHGIDASYDEGYHHVVSSSRMTGLMWEFMRWFKITSSLQANYTPEDEQFCFFERPDFGDPTCPSSSSSSSKGTDYRPYVDSCTTLVAMRIMGNYIWQAVTNVKCK